jgi:hypothetical protein
MANINDETSDNSTHGKVVVTNQEQGQKSPNEHIVTEELVKDDQMDKGSKEISDKSKDDNQHEALSEHKITSELLDSIREKLRSYSMELDPNINIDQERRQYFESWKKTNRISAGQWDIYDTLLHLIRGTLSFFKAYHIVYDDAADPFVVVTIGRRDALHHTYDVVVKKVTENDGNFHVSAEGTQIRNATHLFNDIFNLKTLGEKEYENYESDLKSVPGLTVARGAPLRTPPSRGAKTKALNKQSDSGSGNNNTNSPKQPKKSKINKSNKNTKKRNDNNKKLNNIYKNNIDNSYSQTTTSDESERYSYEEKVAERVKKEKGSKRKTKIDEELLNKKPEPKKKKSLQNEENYGITEKMTDSANMDTERMNIQIKSIGGIRANDHATVVTEGRNDDCHHQAVFNQFQAEFWEQQARHERERRQAEERKQLLESYQRRF